VREVGVVYDPLLDELYHALRGGGAWLGARRLAVSEQDELGRALVATGFAYDVHGSHLDNAACFARMLKAARGIRRDGSAALDLCYVAAGRFDAYWEFKLKAWDVAGGRSRDRRGRRAGPFRRLVPAREQRSRARAGDGAPARVVTRLAHSAGSGSGRRSYTKAARPAASAR
jgi:hypothetical protein